MSEIAIKAEGVSKRYRIGLDEKIVSRQERGLLGALTKPIENFKRIRNLARFSGDNASGDDVFWALRDISFELKRGEVLGIIGKNGAGKSTFLKIVSRITAPTEGRIECFGRIASLLEVGTGFHPELTGRENVFLNGTILGMKRREIQYKFEEIVEFAEVAKFIDTPIKRYSSGMKVRLAFAVAAHLNPEILIIDEVLAVGDIAFQAKCIGKMQQVSGEGRTVLFVSHNMAAVNRLCSRGMLLQDGRKTFEGETDKTVEKYTGNDRLEKESAFNGKNEFAVRTELPAQLTRLSLASMSGKTSALFDYKEQLKLKVDFIIHHSNPDYYLVMDVIDMNGVVVYHSSNTDQGVNEILNRKQKKLSFLLSLPGGLMKPGTYQVTVKIMLRHRYWDPVDEQTIRFSIQDNSTYRGARNDYSRVAVVAPEIHWQLL